MTTNRGCSVPGVLKGTLAAMRTARVPFATQYSPVVSPCPLGWESLTGPARPVAMRVINPVIVPMMSQKPDMGATDPCARPVREC